MFADLVDLVLPRYCLGCGAGGAGVCADCLAVHPVVRHVPGVGAIHAAASYSDAVSTAIIHFKDRQRRDLRAVLARLLARSVGSVLGSVLGSVISDAGGPRLADHAGGPRRGGDRPMLVPVPSTTRAARARGGDHMRRLAASAAARHGLRSTPLLRVGRPVEDATGLDARARRANITGAYVCRPATGRPGTASTTVIVVDDVVTTGASLIEAVRSLRAAGWTVRGAAVIAAVALTPGASGRWERGVHPSREVGNGAQ